MAAVSEWLLFLLGVLAMPTTTLSTVSSKPLMRQEASPLSLLSAADVDADDREYSDEEINELLQKLMRLELLHLIDGKLLSTCMKDRIKNASRLMTTQVDGDWQSNLVPLLKEAFQYQQEHAGSGIAILMTGQVRTGIYPEVVDHMQKHVFQPLKKQFPDDPIEVFALLAFTSGGYHAWQNLGHTSAATDISRNEVEKMLKGYGATYTLEEFTGSNYFPDFDAEGCCDEAHPDTSCGNNHEMSEQWLKVHGAIQMMKQAETSRGQRYNHVVRLRPDLKVWPELRLATSPLSGPPYACAAGGGGADALLALPRWAADAVDNMWRMTRDCPVPGVDECRTRELIQFCTSDKKMKYIGETLCSHFLFIGLLRHGVSITGECIQSVSIVRPK